LIQIVSCLVDKDMKSKQLNKQSFETLIWEMQQTISRMDQLIKKYEKSKK